MIVYPTILPVYLGDSFFMIYIILLLYKKKKKHFKYKKLIKKTKLNKNTKNMRQNFQTIMVELHILFHISLGRFMVEL